MRYACFYILDFLLKEGMDLVSFVLIGKTVRLNPRALIITVYH